MQESEKSSFRGDARAWKVLLPDIADLDHNHLIARKRTPRKIGIARESLKRFKVNRSTVAARQSDGIYRVYAGNCVLKSALSRSRAMW